MKKAEATRHNILQKAFELIYVNGYQTTSIDDILATTAVTKGAFYYHFKNKDQMGIAIINEIILPTMQDTLIKSIAASDNPVKDIYALIKGLLFDTPFLQPQYGCPVGNMAQEAAHLEKDFALALKFVIDECNKGVEQCIQNGKKAGRIDASVNGRQVAYFVMSGYWGIRSMAKTEDSDSYYNTYLKELKRYLKTLEKK